MNQSRFPEFSTLPRDIRQIHFSDVAIDTLPLPDLLSLCQSSSIYRRICQDPSTWYRRLERDFGWSRSDLESLNIPVDPLKAYRALHLAQQYGAIDTDGDNIGPDRLGLLLSLPNLDRLTSILPIEYLTFLIRPDIKFIIIAFGDELRLTYYDSGNWEIRLFRLGFDSKFERIIIAVEAGIVSSQQLIDAVADVIQDFIDHPSIIGESIDDRYRRLHEIVQPITELLGIIDDNSSVVGPDLVTTYITFAIYPQ